MRLKLALLTTAVAFGLGTTAALAEEATGATSDITIVENSGANNVPGTQSEGKNDGENPGALSAPEKKATGNQPNATGGMTDDAAANVPGANADGDSSVENQGSLSAPEKDKSSMAPSGTGGMTDDSAANVPGASADGDSSIQNQGSLSAPEKDSKKM